MIIIVEDIKIKKPVEAEALAEAAEGGEERIEVQRSLHVLNAIEGTHRTVAMRGIRDVMLAVK